MNALAPGQGILKGTLFTPPNTHPGTTVTSNLCHSNVMEGVPSAFQRLITLCVLVPPSTPFLKIFTTLSICAYLCLLFQSYLETGSFSSSVKYDGFPGGSHGRVYRQCRRPGFNPWVGKMPRRRTWQPIPVFLTGEFHGQRSLVGYSPWGHKESDTTEQLTR